MTSALLGHGTQVTYHSHYCQAISPACLLASEQLSNDDLSMVCTLLVEADDKQLLQGHLRATQ